MIKKDNVRLQTTISKQNEQKLIEQAKQLGISKNDYVRMMIIKFINKEVNL